MLNTKYPKAKHSHIIYEAGNRSLTDPFSKRSFSDLIEETEGPQPEEEDGSLTFTVNHQGLTREKGGQYPNVKNRKYQWGLTDKAEPGGYPREKEWLQKLLSKYIIKAAWDSAIEQELEPLPFVTLPRLLDALKNAGADNMKGRKRPGLFLIDFTLEGKKRYAVWLEEEQDYHLDSKPIADPKTWRYQWILLNQTHKKS